jgi:hypothetical protein
MARLIQKNNLLTRIHAPDIAPFRRFWQAKSILLVNPGVRELCAPDASQPAPALITKRFSKSGASRLFQKLTAL